MTFDRTIPSEDEVHSVARGIATAVSPASGITDVQSSLLRAITKALTDLEIDYRDLDPLAPGELGQVLEGRNLEYRQRIVHHMVLGELVLTPLPADVAERVGAYAAALGVEDDFVRIARRYSAGMLGLAWEDLRRNGFTERWDDSKLEPLHTKARLADQWDAGGVDAELAARWAAFEQLPEGTLGRGIWEMYAARGFAYPGAAASVPAYLAQHDFVHVLADYGTTLDGELEVFALIGRADPDPKGFAWLATVVGLFETGYVHEQGVFEADVEEHPMRDPGMGVRLADAIRRGKAVEETFATDLLAVDYHDLAGTTLDEVRERLRLPPKCAEAIAAGSPGVFEPAGLSEAQRAAAARARV